MTYAQLSALAMCQGFLNLATLGLLIYVRAHAHRVAVECDAARKDRDAAVRVLADKTKKVSQAMLLAETIERAINEYRYPGMKIYPLSTYPKGADAETNKKVEQLT